MPFLEKCMFSFFIEFNSNTFVLVKHTLFLLIKFSNLLTNSSFRQKLFLLIYKMTEFIIGYSMKITMQYFTLTSYYQWSLYKTVNFFPFLEYLLNTSLYLIYQHRKFAWAWMEKAHDGSELKGLNKELKTFPIPTAAPTKAIIAVSAPIYFSLSNISLYDKKRGGQSGRRIFSPFRHFFYFSISD